MRKLTIDDFRRIAASKDLPLKPMPIKISEDVKKYDKIYMSQEQTKKVLGLK